MVTIYQYHVLCLSSAADINCLLSLFTALAASCGWKSLAGAGPDILCNSSLHEVSSFHHFQVKLTASRHIWNLRYLDFKMCYPRPWTSYLCTNILPQHFLMYQQSSKPLSLTKLYPCSRAFHIHILFMQFLPSITSSPSQFLVLFFVPLKLSFMV